MLDGIVIDLKLVQTIVEFLLVKFIVERDLILSKLDHYFYLILVLVVNCRFFSLA